MRVCMHAGDTELAAHKLVKPGGTLAHVMNTGSDKARAIPLQQLC